MGKTSPPPPPKPGERRSHTRVGLLAQVQVSRQSEIYIMPTVNVSCGGMFLRGSPSEAPELHLETEVGLTLFDPDDLGAEVTARARVVRIEAPSAPGRADRGQAGWGQTPEARVGGFGLEFTDIDEPNLTRLRRLLGLA